MSADERGARLFLGRLLAAIDAGLTDAHARIRVPRIAIGGKAGAPAYVALDFFNERKTRQSPERDEMSALFGDENVAAFVDAQQVGDGLGVGDRP